MSLGENIRKLRKAKGLTLDDLHKQTGAHIGFLSNVEKGKRNPSLDTLSKIAEALGVTPSELLDAENHLATIIKDYIDDHKITIEEFAKACDLDVSVIEKYLDSNYTIAIKSEDEYQILSQIAQGLQLEIEALLISINYFPISIKDYQQNPNDKIFDMEYVKVPRIRFYVSNGQVNEIVEDFTYMSKSEVPDSNHFYYRVRDNSMINARIKQGDLVLVRRQTQASDGDLIILFDQKEVSIRRLLKKDNLIALQPENSEFKTLMLTEEEMRNQKIKILGRIMSLKINF